MLGLARSERNYDTSCWPCRRRRGQWPSSRWAAGRLESAAGSERTCPLSEAAAGDDDDDDGAQISPLTLPPLQRRPELTVDLGNHLLRVRWLTLDQRWMETGIAEPLELFQSRRWQSRPASRPTDHGQWAGERGTRPLLIDSPGLACPLLLPRWAADPLVLRRIGGEN